MSNDRIVGRESIVSRLVAFMLKHPRQPTYWGAYARRIGATTEELGSALRAHGTLTIGDDDAQV